MTDVGTWAWAERTGGAMSRADRLDQLRQGVLARLAALPGRWRREALGSDHAPALPDPPDSLLARTAEERVREVSSSALHAHCLRTWLYSAAFAELDRTAHDPELLYLACVLHDLGLTPAHDGQDPAAVCFGVEGARAAHRLVAESGGSEELALRAAEAICLHLNVNVDAALGPEAHLLSKGVTLDVVGHRLKQMPAAAVEEVERLWPRDGFAAELKAATERQARIRPRSRSAFLKGLGFSELVLANPLVDSEERSDK